MDPIEAPKKNIEAVNRNEKFLNNAASYIEEALIPDHLLAKSQIERIIRQCAFVENENPSLDEIIDENRVIAEVMEKSHQPVSAREGVVILMGAAEQIKGFSAF